MTTIYKGGNLYTCRYSGGHLIPIQSVYSYSGLNQCPPVNVGDHPCSCVKLQISTCSFLQHNNIMIDELRRIAQLCSN